MSNKPGVRCMYERRIIAILISAVITIVMQTAFMIPSYQSDATSEAEYGDEVTEKDYSSSIFKKHIKTQIYVSIYGMKKALYMMSVPTKMTATSTTTTTTTTTTTITSSTTTTTTTTSETTSTTTTTTTTVESTTVEETTIVENVEPAEEIQAEEPPTEEEIPVDEPSEEEPQEEVVAEEPVEEIPQEDSGEASENSEEVVSEENCEPEEESLPISESDFILLCNCVAHEYGSNWVSVPEKALVVEVVMNRVNHSAYPNTIYGVISAPCQFTGASTYMDLGTYSNKVTESVKEAVRYYFANPHEFQHGYYGFWGDGRRNHFR